MIFPEFKANEREARKLSIQQQAVLSNLAKQVDKARWDYCLADDRKNKVNLVAVK